MTYCTVPGTGSHIYWRPFVTIYFVILVSVEIIDGRATDYHRVTGRKGAIHSYRYSGQRGAGRGSLQSEPDPSARTGVCVTSYDSDISPDTVFYELRPHTSTESNQCRAVPTKIVWLTPWTNPPPPTLQIFEVCKSISTLCLAHH